MIRRTIILEQHADNEWTVREGERDSYTPRLCWDEMLGAVAEATHPRIGTVRYGNPGTREHTARHQKHLADCARNDARGEAREALDDLRSFLDRADHASLDRALASLKKLRPFVEVITDAEIPF